MAPTRINRGHSIALNQRKGSGLAKPTSNPMA